jgi:hypothetical protein
MMWMSDIAANGPMPSSRPARIFTIAWLTRRMSGNSPERAMICPSAIGSSLDAADRIASGEGCAPLAGTGTADIASSLVVDEARKAGRLARVNKRPVATGR